MTQMRRRNLVTPADMPYTPLPGPGAYVYDSGDFGAALDRCLAAADWEGFPGRRAASEALWLRSRMRSRRFTPAWGIPHERRQPDHRIR